MTIRTIAISLSIGVSCLLAPSSARAECITPGLWSLEQPLVELVFSGTVLKIEPARDGVRVTFDVERVWKGSAPARFTLYVWQDYGMPTFEASRRYVAFATRMDARSRQGVGLTEEDAVVFRPVDCGALAYEFAQKSGTIRDLGEGQPPK
jgi:hypothetical protein